MEPIRYLLDTHTLVWWLLDEPYLSDTARNAIAHPENILFVSSASGWEIATKHRLGKLQKAKDLIDNLPQLISRSRMNQLHITMEHALFAGTLSGPHRDPFDRMLIAQSKIENLPVITKDPVFHEYGVQVYW